MSEQRRAFTTAVEDTLWKIDEAEAALAASDGDADALTERIAALHASLLALKADAHRPALTVDVPLDLVAAVDAGTHPDAFTASVFARAHRGNQLAAGKAAALGVLSGELLQAARETFPDSAAEYEALAAAPAAAAADK